MKKPIGSSESPLQKSVNSQFRTLLDAVDKLLSMGVMTAGIELPTIVVVGDQSHGKSSVLESLAGIDLPRGTGTVTRVPLVLQLRKEPKQEITIKYENKDRIISEDEIEEAINTATNELAGGSKNIVNKRVTLRICKPDVPNLTMVDLPGITRIPIDDQPENIYDQVKEIILEYISSERSIILNVLSAEVDFTTCESIKMSREVDPSGKRTLAVVTKVDRAPESVYDRVTANAVRIGLGYVCVCNKTDRELSHEEARLKEKELFENNKHLMKLRKNMVGVVTLAKRLTRIQESSIRESLPGIVKQINSSISEKKKELQILPQQVDNPGIEFQRVLRKIEKELEQLLTGKFDVLGNDKQAHYTARLYEIFDEFKEKLRACHPEFCSPDNIKAVTEFMTESKGFKLPNFLPSWVFEQLISGKIEEISEICLQVVTGSHDYAKSVAIPLVNKYTKAWPELLYFYNQNVEATLTRSMMKCEKFVKHKLEKEARVVFTFDSCYMSLLEDIRRKLLDFTTVEAVLEQIPDAKLNIGSLRGLDKGVLEMVLSLIAYWKVTRGRLVDEIALELIYALEKALTEQLEEEIQHAGLEADMHKLMGEDPDVSLKRQSVTQTLQMLQECAAVVAKLSSSASFFSP